MLDLATVISAIVRMAVKKTWDEAKRREAVIKLLKRLKFDPNNPPVDFDGIYTYSLIEYGVDRPEPVLNFFRYKFVREAFEKAFYENDASILDKEAEGIIEWSEETGKLGRIDYDPRREFAAFSAIFHEIVDRTRTPAEVKRDQKLDNIREDIHYTSTEIVKRLDVLVSLSEVRNERDRLVQRTALNNLAQQMRDWFTALAYSFESHSVQTDDHFEWIINVPARRGYDRVLVRGIDGAAGIDDINALRASVDRFRSNEGWLVTVQRIDQSAHDAVKRWENRDLFCYTFDELLDENANFDHYLDWLEDEVKRKGIDKMYVPLACKKEDIDPATKQKLGESCYDASNGGIDGYIDRWIDDPSKEHVSVLGEFGTGKSWFTLHYAWITLRRYRDAKVRGVKRPRVPLVIPLRDYAKAVSVESLFSEFFFRKYEIRLPNYSAFELLNRMGKLLIIFDGFDEMADKVDRQKMINNFWELAQVVVSGSKVILTCRLEHFPEAREGRALLNAELQASTSNLSGEPPQFEVLELKHFDDDQVRQALSFHAEPNVVNKVINHKELLDLARRPLMVEFILEALPDITEGKPIDLSRVYMYAVRRKIERDIKDERTFTSLVDKLFFLCELSWEMLTTDKMSMNYRLFPDRIRRIFGSKVQEQKDLDHWHYDMMAQTLLIRNSDGDYTPAHRSLLEFFVALKYAAELGILAQDFTDLFRQHINDKAPLQNYSWSSYFKPPVNENKKTEPTALLKEFVAEDINTLIETVGKIPLTKAILDLARNMLNSDKKILEARLLTVINYTRGKPTEKVGYVGGNALSLLVWSNPAALIGRDLSEVNISFANLGVANLSKCNLDRANMSHVQFNTSKLVEASMRESNLNYAELVSPADFTRCNFDGADLSNAVFGKPIMIKASMRQTILQNIEFTQLHEDGQLYWLSAMTQQNKYRLDFEHYFGSNLADFMKRDSVFPEVTITFQMSQNIIWKQKLRNTFIFDAHIIFDSKMKLDKSLLELLCLDGKAYLLSLKDGEIIDHRNKMISLLNWKDADMEECLIDNDIKAYYINIHGAKNLNISYDIKQNDYLILLIEHQIFK